jgi:hypothetical protein
MSLQFLKQLKFHLDSFETEARAEIERFLAHVEPHFADPRPSVPGPTAAAVEQALPSSVVAASADPAAATGAVPLVQTAMATVSIPAPTLGAAQEPVQDPAPAALAADPQQPAQGA